MTDWILVRAYRPVILTPTLLSVGCRDVNKRMEQANLDSGWKESNLKLMTVEYRFYIITGMRQRSWNGERGTRRSQFHRSNDWTFDFNQSISGEATKRWCHSTTLGSSPMEDDDSGDIPKQPEQSTAFDYWDTFGSRANRFRIFSGKEGDGRDRQQQQKKGRERERCVSFRGGVQWGTRVTEADNAQQTGGDKKRTDRQNKGGSEDGSERDFRLDCTSLFQVRPFVDKLIRVTESALNV